MKILKVLTLIIALSFLTIACGSDGDSGPLGVERTSVNVEMDDNDCFVSAGQNDDFFNYVSGSYWSQTYTWYCASYKGQTDIYVSLDFDNNNNGSTCLKFTSEYISDGIC